jgi:hypothetical protein
MCLSSFCVLITALSLVPWVLFVLGVSVGFYLLLCNMRIFVGFDFETIPWDLYLFVLFDSFV